MSLYTVSLTRTEIVCKYDPITGHRIGEEKRAIPQTYGDLPHVLAMRYATMFPDNNVVITQQEGTYTPPEHVHREPTYRRGYGAKEVVTATASKPSAAATGDLAAAFGS